MRLADLHPEWVEKSEHESNPNVERYLEFLCPTCPEDDRCYGVLIPVGKDGAHCWGWNGEDDFEKVTITPSIWHHCKSDPHFFIREGEIQFA